MTRKTVLQGFTLLEVLLALSILSISLLGVMKSTLLVQKALFTSTSRCLAAELGGNRLAQIKRAGLDAIMHFSGTFESHPGYSWQLEEIPAGEEDLLLIRLDIFQADVSKPVFRLEELFLQQSTQ